MTARTFGWGIVGTGMIATRFAEDLRFAEGAAAAAVCSRRHDTAEAFAKAHEVGTAHDDLDAFLADETIDAVYIASPNQAHLDQTLAAIAAGKPVLIEKPVAMTAAEARQMAEAAREAGVFIMEALWTRFLPAVQRAREIFNSGAIGEPVRASATLGFTREFDPKHRLYDPALGGGVLLDLGVYPLSTISMLLGPAKLVSGTWQPAPTGVDASAQLALDCGGVPVEVVASFGGELENTVVIHGTKGVLRIDRHFLRTQSVTVWDRPLAEIPPSASLAGRIRKRIPAPGRRTERFDYQGSGLQFEAMAAQEAILAGETGCETMPMEDSAATLAIIEQVLANPPEG